MTIVAYLMLGAFGAALGVCLCDALDERKPTSTLKAQQVTLNEKYGMAKAALLALATALFLAPFILQ